MFFSYWRRVVGCAVIIATLAISSTLRSVVGAEVKFEFTPQPAQPADFINDAGFESLAIHDESVEPVNFYTDGYDVGCDDWTLFAGLAGAKQPQDFGVNAQFGIRTAVNYGRAIGNSGLGWQLGTAITATDHAVQVTERVEGAENRFQSFTTLGLFQNVGNWRWGAGYDLLWQDDYDSFFLGQWRGIFGCNVTRCDEVGLRMHLQGHGDNGFYGTIPVYLRSINQVTGFWNHTFQTGAVVGGWAGITDDHGEVNVALGDRSRRDASFVFGSMIHAPLNDHLALFGESNFIFPADTGTVDAYLGFEFYPRGGARSGRAYRPVLPVASNPTMSIDLLR